MTIADPLFLVGTTVAEKYVIERAVGEGGFAIVYRAMHTVWKRPVAIKVFRALGDLPPDRRAQLVESFIQEGRLLADLSERSAAICQARDVGSLRTADGREMPFMVLEWLEGQSLDEMIESEKARLMPPRDAEQVVHILEPAAEALALAHRKGIAHRDVKPANIFILGDPRGDYTVKLLDFGIAKVVQDAQRLGGSFAQTSGNVSSFTPAYGAPEQFTRTHGATGPWTDVFALALVFTELMTNQPALVGDDLTQLAFCAMDPRTRPTPRARGAQIPDALEAVLERALAPAVDARFKTMSEFWEAVRAALAMEPLRAIATSPGIDSQRIRGAAAVSATGQTQPEPPPSSASLRTGGVTHGLPVTPSTPFAPGPPPAARSGGALAAVGIGVAVLVVGGAVVGGLALRGRGKAVVAGSTSASTTGAVTPPARASSATAPEKACPPGMTRIPGGKFFMGSDDKKDEPIERPAHQVTLSPYCMDTTEVTVEQYKACSDRGECKRGPTENEWEGINASAHKLYDPLCNIRDPDGRAKHPINCIDYELASAFCKASGRQLPTEAQWEYATRGSDGRKYPWGDAPPTSGDFLNACGSECVAWGKKHPDPENPLATMYAVDDGFPNTAPAASFPKGASPFGLQDVVGNVWEWVSDWHAPYGPDALVDPGGPPSGTERGIRGGAWNGSDPSWVRPTYRFKLDPKLRSHGIGLRCAKTL